MSRSARTLSRFFVEGSRAVGDSIALSSADAHKVRNVLRLHQGDSIETIDSAGVCFVSRIVFEGEAVLVQPVDIVHRASEARLRITLAQGVPRGSKMDFVVEKATELGVVAILPFFSSRSIGEHVGSAKLDRWRRLARSAAAQSGRQVEPAVDEPVGWDQLVDRFAGYDRVVLAWEVADRIALRVRLAGILGSAGSVLAIVGAEGGLTHAEAERAVDAGAEVVSLGERIFRTETAGLVICTALLLTAGDL